MGLSPLEESTGPGILWIILPMCELQPPLDWAVEIFPLSTEKLQMCWVQSFTQLKLWRVVRQERACYWKLNWNLIVTLMLMNYVSLNYSQVWNLSQPMVKILLPKTTTLLFHLKSSPVLPKCLLNSCSFLFVQDEKLPGFPKKQHCPVHLLMLWWQMSCKHCFLDSVYQSLLCSLGLPFLVTSLRKDSPTIISSVKSSSPEQKYPPRKVISRRRLEDCRLSGLP